MPRQAGTIVPGGGGPIELSDNSIRKIAETLASIQIVARTDDTLRGLRNYNMRNATTGLA
jgi:hypothetical protein